MSNQKVNPLKITPLNLKVKKRENSTMEMNL